MQQWKIHTLEIASFEIFFKTFNFDSIELSPLYRFFRSVKTCGIVFIWAVRKSYFWWSKYFKKYTLIYFKNFHKKWIKNIIKSIFLPPFARYSKTLRIWCFCDDYLNIHFFFLNFFNFLNRFSIFKVFHFFARHHLWYLLLPWRHFW